MRKLPSVLFTLILLACIAHAFYYYPLLPARVASHFGASGRPDAWSSKDFFVKFYLGAVAFIGILFPAMGWSLFKMPYNLINLPNKEYWLAPERRQQSLAELSRQFLWFGSATLLLLLDMMHQSFQVHLGLAPRLDHPVASIIIYMAVSVLWSIGLIVKFVRKPQ